MATNVPSAQSRQLSFFTGDYNFLMARLPDKTEGMHNIGPENLRQGAWARVLPSAAKLELTLDTRFAASFKRGTYLDQPENAGRPFQLVAAGKQITVTPKGTGRWHTAELALPDGALSAEPSGAHVRIIPVPRRFACTWWRRDPRAVAPRRAGADRGSLF